jgi:outer membrane protein assembly factor BamD
MKQGVFVFKKVCLIFIIGVFIVSCGKKVTETRDAELSFREGLAFFNEKKYKKAAKAFENALMQADNPDFASKAQLFLADSYYFSKKYEEAIPSYEMYLEVYPDSEFSKQALHRLALCYYNQKLSVDRDQTNTQKALDYFIKLTEKYPEYAKEQNIPEKIRELRNMLAEKEFYIARFYIRINKLNASQERFYYLFENYSDTDVYPEALIYYAKFLVKRMDRKAEAVSLLTKVLKSKSADEKYLSKVSKLLREIQEDL